ncbi:TPA: hypothetical protein ACH3X1_014861 [Trebouxia sp. C0004]
MAHALNVAPKLTQFEKDSASRCVEQAKNCLMLLLAAMKNMQEDKPWMHAWGALWPWRWTKDKRAPDRLMHWLRSLVDGVLTKDQTRKILDYLIVTLDPGTAEASASEAAAQLIAEEEQAASKAAAKIAKKLRQKQAKERQTQVSATETRSAELMNTESNSALPVQGGTDSGSKPADQSQQHLQTGLNAVLQPDRLSPALPVSFQDTRSAVGAAQSQCTMHVPSEHDEASLQYPNGLSASPEVAAAAPASTVPSQEQSPDACFLQNLFCCPITQVQMADPVIAADGRSCERIAMEDGCSTMTHPL